MQNANNNLVPKELDDLIQEYLTDGVISPKERQVLLNKANELGLNVDEVDLYIDAQQQKADQAVAAAVNKRRGKTCPFCGSPIPELTDKCPNCGQLITVEASKELEEILEKLESALVGFKQGGFNQMKKKAEVERYVRRGKMFYESNPKVKSLLEEVENEKKAIERGQRKRTMVAILLLIIGFGLLPLLGILAPNKTNKGVETTQVESTVDENLDSLSTVQKTVKKATQALDNGDVDEAAKLLKRCDASSLRDSYGDGPSYKTAVSEVVDAYLEEGEKKKAQNLVTTCAMKFIYTSYMRELYEKLGGDPEKGFED